MTVPFPYTTKHGSVAKMDTSRIGRESAVFKHQFAQQNPGGGLRVGADLRGHLGEMAIRPHVSNCHAA